MSRKINIEVNNDGHKQKLVLKTNSPGDGALSVNCVYPSDTSGETAPFAATENDVMTLRDTHFRDYGILKMGRDNGQYRLFKPVDRESDNKVTVEGRTYRYNFDADAVYDRVSLFAEDQNGKEIRINNDNLESAVDFYLRHEPKILEAKNQFGNQDAFKLSISGQAKQDRASGYNM